MAYRAKYRYRWASQNGNQGEVLLLKDGYTGAVIDRPLGRAPELSMEQNGHIHGTSLVLYLECREDGEYSELYTSSAKEWQVQLWWNGRSLWTGYLTPELYSEPDIAPPYDVCVTATDGLGELKRSEYKPASWDVSLEDHLYSILALTGLDQTIYHTGGISADGRPGASMLHEVKVDLSHLQGKTCYDVLDSILTAINAELTTWGQQWMLLRPSDLDNVSADLALYPANGGGSQTWSIPSYGSARTHGRWPVGQMSTQIIASRSAVTVQSPNHLREGSELSPDGWSGSGSTAIRVEAGATSASGELITEGHWELMAGGSISQSVKYSKGLGAHTLRIDQYGLSKVRITYRTSSGSEMHVLGMANGQVGWDMGGDILIGSQTRETLEIPIPAWAGAGTLTVSIAQYNIVSPVTAVYGVSFAVNGVSYGLELRLDLSNGARSEADAVESAFSTYPGGEESYDVLLSQSGLPSFGGSPVSRWSTTNLGSQSYIGFLAMDIALGCALPRARKTGKLNVPQGADPTFLLLSDGSRNYFVNTYTVDLLEDEVSVDMVSLPAAELGVAEETYSAMTGGSSASYGSGSPGAQALPGYTVLSYEEAVALSEDPGDRTIPSAWALKTHISDGVKHITSAERTKWNKVVSDFAAITGNDADSVINKWEEVVAFLDTYTEADTLANLLSNYAPASHTHTFASLTEKPTTISGYGITDGIYLLKGSGSYVGARSNYGENMTGDKYLEWWNSAGWVHHKAGKYSVYGGTSSQFLKADGSLDSTAYYPTSGGNINGTDTTPVNINTSSTTEVGLSFNMSNSPKGWVGYTPNVGSYLYVYGGHKLGLTDAGVGFLDSNTLIHSGNYNSYSPKLDGTGAAGTWGIDISGNAATATKLATARTLWGQSFDGTGNVSGALTGVTDLTMSGRLSDGAARFGLYVKGYAADYGSAIYLTHDHGRNQTAFRIHSHYDKAVGALSIGFSTTTQDYNASPVDATYAEMLHIRGNGNIGIGTTSPSAKLHVNGNLRASSLTLDGTNLLEWDESNSAWKFNGNLIATGFIASGDLSAQAAALAEEENRIAALEAQVAELQAEIENLKAQ